MLIPLLCMTGEPSVEESRRLLRAYVNGITMEPDTDERGLPAYTPTEPQPTRCGGTES